MNYFRQKRIELTDIDARFKDCYLMVGTKSFPEVVELKKKISKISNKSEIITIKINKERRKEDVDEEKLESLLEQDDQLTDELMGIYLQITKENLISGKIWDGEMRDVTKEDVEKFDTEVIKRIVSSVLGDVSKKA